MIPSPLHPAPLKKGDTLAVIAPSGQLRDFHHFTKGVTLLEEMGFHVIFPRQLWPGQDYLSDSDQNRALEFNKAYANPEIKGIISMRGGYGCLRMIERIDLKQITQHPKIVVGFSDITVLLNYLYTRTGLVSFHGPVVTSLNNGTNFSHESLYHCLTGKWRTAISPKRLEILKDGPNNSGPLVGGNLASLVTLLGTPYDFSWDKKIVLLEDIDEPPYRIDRMLTQLFLANKFTAISGLILGDFSFSSYQDDIEKLRYKEQVWNRILDLCEHTTFPVWANFPCGHGSENITIPLGAMAEMNREKASVVFR